MMISTRIKGGIRTRQIEDKEKTATKNEQDKEQDKEQEKTKNMTKTRQNTAKTR
jgi:hypothetical protein